MEIPKPNYKISIVSELFDLITLYPNHSAGELFYEFLRSRHLNGKHLLEATDEEIYSALDAAKKRAEETDEPMSDEEFKAWQEKQ